MIRKRINTGKRKRNQYSRSTRKKSLKTSSLNWPIAKIIWANFPWPSKFFEMQFNSISKWVRFMTQSEFKPQLSRKE